MSNLFTTIMPQKTYKYTRENIDKLFPKEEPVSVKEAVAEIESVSTEVEPVSEEKLKKPRKTKASE